LPPIVGEPAPDFTLPSTSGANVTLSAFRGVSHVLLAFFPHAFTEVCTAEMCAFTEDRDRFVAQGATVLPISVDDVPTLQAFKAQERLTVDLLSDVDRTVCSAYGTLFGDTNAANRAYGLVDRDGVLRWMHAEPHPGTRLTDERLLEEIAKLG